MHISFIEIQNFRKLKSVRIDFSEQTTLFVGANNSGKTSATIALRNFLVETDKFSTNDFTLSNWANIEGIAKGWEADEAKSNVPPPTLEKWEESLPSLDVWLNVEANEIHYVRGILPSLDWVGGALGVRLRYEPKSVTDLQKDYLTERRHVREAHGGGAATVALWPDHMRGYLDRRLKSQFVVRAYLLDATKCSAPVNGIAKPQLLPSEIGPVDGNPLKELIRVHAIAAQRGLGQSESGDHDEQGEPVEVDRKALSEQLRNYYKKHLDPATAPEPKDLAALAAIEEAQRQFDVRLAAGFESAITELQELNYPGVNDPRLRIATQLRPIDGISHSAAVTYELGDTAAHGAPTYLRLPEGANGLGYQNLISMVFRLMAFRDSWMRKGKASKATVEQSNLQPVHLVIIEEPEAHLHPQVQQVFVRKAYDILRNHPELGAKKTLRTQLIVSTHSSHVAHECEFSSLRYFRRLAPDVGAMATSAVINLTTVFGVGDQTKKFVTRYIRSVHCDLFFADAAILVEGDAERILVPHFIRKHFPALHRCYVTLMQVGGAHAHRLRDLIDHLGLTTLVITDVDTGAAEGHHKFQEPKRGCGQVTNNPTLKAWHPNKKLYDELLVLTEAEKEKISAFPQYSVRVAYQCPVQIAPNVEALPSTFEDAFTLENLALVKDLPEGGALMEALKAAINAGHSNEKIGPEISRIIRETKGKAEFALDVLFVDKDLKELAVPAYIKSGLQWLENKLVDNQKQLLVPRTIPPPAPSDAATSTAAKA